MCFLKSELTKIRFLLTISFLFIFNAEINGQDTIFFKNGMQLPARVIEIFPDSLRCGTFEHADSVLKTILTDSINSIKYANGKIELFKNKKISNKTNHTPADPQESYLRGIEDARKYYRGNSALGFTLLAASPASAFALSTPYAFPLTGVGSAIVFSCTQPHKIITSDITLLSNPDYIKGYKHEAKKKRLSKSLAGLGIGLAIDLTVILLGFSLTE